MTKDSKESVSTFEVDRLNEAQVTNKAGRRGRVFDYGELRLLLLMMLAKQPSHGYELIHEIKAHFEGLYKPSPGVIYPALTWLYDRSYTRIELEKGGRKCYSITEEGEAFLTANQAIVDKLMSRKPSKNKGKSPELLVEAMSHLKNSLSLRIKREPVGDETIAHMAAIIHSAADQLEALLTQLPAPENALQSVARITTPNAARFLRRLCTHFKHRTAVIADETSGQFRLSIGEVKIRLEDDALVVTVTADAREKLSELEQIIERHLEEAAVRETLRFDWLKS
ncbi:DUF2218 domain-containing protein [Cedecea colo]|uniref:DUF2218 domain-containing protein n=1 Tax=Cedecea colo TaxID=2552946 RepID=UPI001F32DB01|nr:DUF2218 domain-containing protein [Cedecea colo]